MRQDYDLTQPARHAPPDANTPPTNNKASVWKSPSEMMHDLGFDPNTGDLTPLQFLVAVMNDDVDKLYRQEKKREMMRKKGIGMNYRVECAKTASRFMHMAQPQVTVQTAEEDDFHRKLEDNIRQGNDRFIRKKMIIETVERVSPDMPLPAASYPPVFSDEPTPQSDGHDPQPIPQPQDLEAVVVAEGLDPEGNMDYNPDEHD